MDKGIDEMSNLFVRVFNQILSREEQSFKNMGFKDLTLREVHVLEAVFALYATGNNRMSEIAKYLSITPGSLTVSVNGLVNKGYLERQNNPGDRRVVLIVPTDKAENVYKIHSKSRNEMIAEIVAQMQPCDNDWLYEVFQKLNIYFEKNKNTRV